MNFDDALRLTELGAGLALAQSSAEQVFGGHDARGLWALRGGLALLLAAGHWPAAAACGLLACGTALLQRYDGPYNGGSDRMSLLILLCVAGAELAPTPYTAQLAFGYLAVQILLSYAISGWVKVVNPEWRDGRALRDVFAFSAYPASESLRGWAAYPTLLWLMGWAVMGFELLMPLALFNPLALKVALTIAATFHLANAVLFGLNRFFWIWLASYPAVWWLQSRIL